MINTIVSLFFSFFFLSVQAVFVFPSVAAFVVTTKTTTWRKKNHCQYYYLDNSCSIIGCGSPVKRRWHNHPKKKKTIALCSSSSSRSIRSSMDETYDLLAHIAIEKLNLLQQHHQQGSDNNNDDIHSRKRRRRRLWIGLAGGPGSGKSTVAAAVVERINQKFMKDYNNKNVSNSAMVLPMDGFHYTQTYLKQHNIDIKRRGAPWTFDAKKMYEKLHAVKMLADNDNNNNNKTNETTKSFWFPLYNREISDPVENAICINDSHDIIIVEGLYILLGALTDQMQDPQSPLWQTIQTFSVDQWSPSSSSSDEQKNDNHSSSTTTYCIPDEIAKWKPITDMMDETWYVQASGGLPEQERRLIQRSLKTWTSAKTQLWGGTTAKQSATRRVQYNDTPNGQLVECCRPYANRVIETR